MLGIDARIRGFQLDAAPEYAGKVYRLEGRPFAYVVKGWEVGPTLDGEDAERTGYLVLTALGDDHASLAEPGELIALGDDGFCRGCGELDCGAHGDFVEDTVVDSALTTGKARKHYRYSRVEPIGERVDGTTLYRYRGACQCGWVGEWHVADVCADPIGNAIDDGEQHVARA